MNYSDFMNAGGTTPPSTEPYVRPSEWTDMPVLQDTDKKFCALVQVFDTDSEFVALKFDGDFSIDWGDGTAGTQAGNNGSGVIEHKYDFANCSSTTYGYNVALIQVTGTGSWAFIDLTIKHTSIARRTWGETTPFLDISIAGQTLTSVSLSNDSMASGADSNRNIKLQVFSMRDNAITDMSSMFSNCYSLTHIPLLATSSVTDMYQMFGSCYSLTTIPLLDTSSATSMYQMFYDCYSLTTIPLLDTSSVTNMSRMFYDCYSLTTIPLLDTSSVTDMTYMFNDCYSLTSATFSDTSSVTDMTYMFGECSSLTSATFSDTSSVTAMTRMFLSCKSLTSATLLDTSSVTSMAYMFEKCSSLTSATFSDTSSVTDMTYMFNDCSSLTTIPLLVTSSVTNMTYMFNDCSSLTTIPLLVTSSVTNMHSMFNDCYSLTKATFSGTVADISYANCKLSADELNEIFTNLGTPATTKTITITGNWGASGCDQTIATNKNYTVIN